MLRDIIDVLADPMDGSALSLADDSTRVISESGHSYDIAKQGYVTLASGAGLKHSGDDGSMIQAREAFLSRGYFATFVEAVTQGIHLALEEAEKNHSEPCAEPVLCDIGAGTGYYLSHALDTIDGSRGIGIDVSVPAAKRLAHCHPRAGAVVADVWSRLPMRDNSIDAILVAFAPRNPAEFARVLAPHGQVIVLNAAQGHLGELRECLGIMDVEPGKMERMKKQAEGYLQLAEEPSLIEFPVVLDQDSIASQIGMSPSARHIDPEERARRIQQLPPTIQVTARAELSRWVLNQ